MQSKIENNVLFYCDYKLPSSDSHSGFNEVVYIRFEYAIKTHPTVTVGCTQQACTHSKVLTHDGEWGGRDVGHGGQLPGVIGLGGGLEGMIPL